MQFFTTLRELRTPGRLMSRIGYSGNRRVAVKGAVGAAFTSGGGRATSKEFVVADGHYTAQVVAIYLPRRASTRLPYLPVSTSAPRPCPLLLLAHPFPRSSSAITYAVIVCLDATTCDCGLTVCVQAETSMSKKTDCSVNELLFLRCKKSNSFCILRNLKNCSSIW